MTEQEHIRVFDSHGEAYKQAFQIFLDHTDQKRNAKRWLQQVVDDLPVRQVFIDARAGNGDVTRAFDRTIAIEPNAYLLNQLRQAVMTAEAIGKPRRVLVVVYVLHMYCTGRQSLIAEDRLACGRISGKDSSHPNQDGA
jgi:hypothetical protein